MIPTLILTGDLQSKIEVELPEQKVANLAWSFLSHCWRLLLLLSSLLWLFVVLCFDIFGWLIVIVNDPQTELIRIEPAFFITLIVAVPPLIFSANWLAAILSGFGLYGAAQWVLAIASRIWSLPFLPGGLGLPIVRAQSADYFRESGKAPVAEQHYEAALSDYRRSNFRFFSGAGLGLWNYSRMLLDQGQKEKANEVWRICRIPICTYLAWTAFRTLCCLVIPILLINLTVALFEDVNGRQLELGKISSEFDLAKFEKHSYEARIARLLPAVEAVEWLYTIEGRIVICGGLASLYIESVRAQSGESKQTLLVQQRPAEFGRDNYRIARFFFERAGNYEKLCPAHASNYKYLDDSLIACNQHLLALERVSSRLLEGAMFLNRKFKYLKGKNPIGTDARTENVQPEVLRDEWYRIKAKLGNSHPFAIERQVSLALSLSLRSDKESVLTALLASRNWMTFSHNLLTAQSAQYTRLPDRQELEIWACQSGLLLANILNAEHLNAELLEQGRMLESLCLASEHPSKWQVKVLLDLARLSAKCLEYGRARAVIKAAQRLSMKLADEHERLPSQLQVKLEDARLSLEQQDFSKSIQIVRGVLSDLDKQKLNDKELLAECLECLALAESMLLDQIDSAVSNQKKCVELRKDLYGPRSLNSLDSEILLLHLLSLQLQDKNSAEAKLDAFPPIYAIINELIRNLDAPELNSDSEKITLMKADANYEIGNIFRAYKKYEMARQCFGKACDTHMFRPEANAVKATVLDLDAIAALDVLDPESQSKDLAHLNAGAKAARQRILWSSKLLSNYLAQVVPQLSLAEQIALNQIVKTQMNSLLAVISACEKERNERKYFQESNNIAFPYAYLIAWKGFLLNQLSLRSQVLNSTNNPALANLMMRHRTVSEKILEAYMRSDAQEDEFLKLAQGKEELERQIGEIVRARFQHDASTIPSAQQIQEKLDGQEALVDLYQYLPFDSKKPHYAAIVSSKNALKWVDFGSSAEINECLEEWRSDLQVGLPDKNARADSSPWARLEELISAPLAKAIPEGVKRLWIVDEGELVRLPWSVLLAESRDLSRIELCQLDSPRELIAVKNARVESGKKSRRILLVGGVDYSGRARPLPGATKEVLSLYEEAKRYDLEPVLLSDSIKTKNGLASREGVMTALAQCLYAHLATHGYFRDASISEQSSSAERSSAIIRAALGSSKLSGNLSMSARNPLIDSGLLVSTGKEKKLASGFLTAEDLLSSDLHSCRLITLSACETGRGQEVTGQGVIGLRSSLMGAGCRTILLSLWKVPDMATSELMKVFYQKLLEGESPVSALKKAQNSIRAQERWKAPKNWAAWILVGDGWQSIQH